MRTLSLIGAVAFLAIAAPSPTRANLIANGGFEDASASGFAGWTITGSGIAPDTLSPNTGNTDAAFTDLNGTTPPSTLSQTVVTTPGTSYTLSLALYDQGGLPQDAFTAQFGDFTATITGDQAAPPGTLPSFYTPFTFDIAGDIVTTPSTTLTFSGYVDPTVGLNWNLDDVGLITTISTSPIGIAEPSLLIQLSVIFSAVILIRIFHELSSKSS